MSDLTYHVRKISLGLKRKYRVSDDDGSGRPGDPLCYGEKQLTVSDRIDLFRDESRADVLATVRESKAGLLAALTGYEVVDAAGALLGSFRSLPTRSIERTTWEIEQPGLGRFRGAERSTRTALGRRLVGLANGVAGQFVNAMAKYHFDFERDGEPMFSIEKPKLLDDWYRLRVYCDELDRSLLFALVMTMEARVRG